MRPFAVMRAGAGHGSYAGGSLDTQTVTVGASGTAGAGNRLRGFITGVIGAISTGASALYGGAAIRELGAEEQGIGGGFDVLFTVTGVVANSGWTSLNVGGNNVLTRVSATFTTTGGNSTWRWPGVGNPFGSTGTIKVGFD